MACSAAQVRHTEKTLQGFDADWEALIQPVIESGSSYRDQERNWAAFSLLLHYLSGEGEWLPFCTKPWIAAIQLFRSIAGDECPRNLQAAEYPFRTSAMGDLPDPHGFQPIESVKRVAGFLATLTREFDEISLSWLREQMTDVASPEIPYECGGLGPCAMLRYFFTRWREEESLRKMFNQICWQRW